MFLEAFKKVVKIINAPEITEILERHLNDLTSLIKSTD